MPPQAEPPDWSGGGDAQRGGGTGGALRRPRSRARRARPGGTRPTRRWANGWTADPWLAHAAVAVLAASRSLTVLVHTDPGALDVLAGREARVPPPTADGPFDEVVAVEAPRAAAHRRPRPRRRLVAGDARWRRCRPWPPRCSRPRTHAPSPTSTPARHLAIVGMGKLGGRELNYASDVDLLLVGEGDEEALDRAGRTVLDLAGRCFKVDADLRPEGRDGLARAEPHRLLVLLVTLGRPVGAAGPAEGHTGRRRRGPRGPVAGGGAVGALVGTFDADDLRQMRELKVRAEEEVRRSGIADREVKRGPGGIRDVEFSAQLLQLVHGRVDEELRTPSTLDALAALSHGGYVDPEDATALTDSYRFLRRVEHAPAAGGRAADAHGPGRRVTTAAGWRACSATAASPTPDPPSSSTGTSRCTGFGCARCTSGCGSDRCWRRCPVPVRSGRRRPPTGSRPSASPTWSAPARRCWS